MLKMQRRPFMAMDIHRIAVVGSGPSGFYTAKYLTDLGANSATKVSTLHSYDFVVHFILLSILP